MPAARDVVITGDAEREADVKLSRRRVLLATAGVGVAAAAVGSQFVGSPSADGPEADEPTGSGSRATWPAGRSRIGESLDRPPPPPSTGWEPRGIPSTEPFPKELPTGNLRPGHDEFEIARAVIECAPYDCRPIDVAAYFEGIGFGGEQLDQVRAAVPEALVDKVGPQYAWEWEGFYNPVIIEFFRATWLEPLGASDQGDQTHWCAAFLNWCILRSRVTAPTYDFGDRFPYRMRKHGTSSASSGSFRCWRDATEAPREGDIVVFAKPGTSVDCEAGQTTARGHVGFYAGEDDDHIHVLGGNQSRAGDDYSQSFSLVSTRRWKRDTLHSIRTADVLR